MKTVLGVYDDRMADKKIKYTRAIPTASDKYDQHCLLNTPHCLLPTKHCLLPTGYCLLNTAN